MNVLLINAALARILLPATPSPHLIFSPADE